MLAGNTRTGLLCRFCGASSTLTEAQPDIEEELAFTGSNRWLIAGTVIGLIAVNALV